jgi:hypothetical protein
VIAASSDDRPIPKKKMIIIERRPHRSPSRPAGSEPRPNITKAPTPNGIRSSQRARPKSAAIVVTAVAKISRNMWSTAWATFSRRMVVRECMKRPFQSGSG